MDFHECQVIIADNQFLIIESLLKLCSEEFGLTDCQVVHNRKELIMVLNSQKPALLIVDHNLMDFDNPSELRKIMQDIRNGTVLVLTNTLSKNEINELNHAGIRNILLKTSGRDEIIAAIRSALTGKKYYCQEVLDIFTEIHSDKGVPKESGNQLTASEVEIVRCIAEGLTTKQIAMHKHISYHTVMTHRKNIFRKLGVNNASELVMYAIRAGIIDTIEYHI